MIIISKIGKIVNNIKIKSTPDADLIYSSKKFYEKQAIDPDLINLGSDLSQDVIKDFQEDEQETSQIDFIA